MARSPTDSAESRPNPGAVRQQLLISAPELAKILDISPRSVWRLHSAGKLIAPIRLGGAVRWRLAEVLEWIELGCPAVNTERDERT